MKTIKEIADRLHSRVAVLVQKVETLSSENQHLYKRITELEKQLQEDEIKQSSSVDVDLLRDTLNAYVDRIDACIEEVRIMK